MVDRLIKSKTAGPIPAVFISAGHPGRKAIPLRISVLQTYLIVLDEGCNKVQNHLTL